MRSAGLHPRNWVRTTLPALEDVRSPDLMQRDWFRDAPDLIWVTDLTHVDTREGWVYVSLLQNGYSPHILGSRSHRARPPTRLESAQPGGQHSAAQKQPGFRR